eukprot:Hpha_TRINITY_DN18841_c0_g1::TRINITY_DN18841_c0_g1_i1::g.26251::m.26251
MAGAPPPKRQRGSEAGYVSELVGRALKGKPTGDVQEVVAALKKRKFTERGDFMTEKGKLLVTKGELKEYNISPAYAGLLMEELSKDAGGQQGTGWKEAAKETLAWFKALQKVKLTDVAGHEGLKRMDLPKEGCPDGSKSGALFVRKQTVDIWAFMQAQRKEGKKFFALKGAPGIGKSCALYYFLWKLLQHKKGVVLLELRQEELRGLVYRIEVKRGELQVRKQSAEDFLPCWRL